MGRVDKPRLDGRRGREKSEAAAVAAVAGGQWRLS